MRRVVDALPHGGNWLEVTVRLGTVLKSYWAEITPDEFVTLDNDRTGADELTIRIAEEVATSQGLRLVRVIDPDEVAN